ncbi:MAG TPA: hypothetical protein HA326_02475, partial [Thermoplasmata archaeon]|nr:hypothetical protein [Thermoplasmata archaeon]
RLVQRLPGRLAPAGSDAPEQVQRLDPVDLALRRPAEQVGGEPCGGIPRASFDPADRTRRIGEVVDADDNVLEEALSRAAAGAPRWDATPAADLENR